MSAIVSGTEGYANEADILFERYESAPFHAVHRAIVHLIPEPPAKILDIGAGTGRDAAAYAEMGHRVVAVEPTAALREGAERLHPSPRITWLDDSLPDLEQLGARGEIFDLVAMTAVWMHLDEAQRRRAMPNVARRVGEGGKLLMTLRHGTVPEGRRMFEVSAEETIALAAAEGLHLLMNIHEQSRRDPNRALGVTWTRLAFERNGRTTG